MPEAIRSTRAVGYCGRRPHLSRLFPGRSHYRGVLGRRYCSCRAAQLFCFLVARRARTLMVEDGTAARSLVPIGHGRWVAGMASGQLVTFTEAEPKPMLRPTPAPPPPWLTIAAPVRWPAVERMARFWSAGFRRAL